MDSKKVNGKYLNAFYNYLIKDEEYANAVDYINTLINLAFVDSECFELEFEHEYEAIDRFFDFYNKKYRGAKFFWNEKLYAELLRIAKKTITVDKKAGISVSETYEKIIELISMPEDLSYTVYLIKKDEVEDVMPLQALLYELLSYDDDDNEPLIPEIALLTELD